jgi:hypothetical protein
MAIKQKERREAKGSDIGLDEGAYILLSSTPLF